MDAKELFHGRNDDPIKKLKKIFFIYIECKPSPIQTSNTTALKARKGWIIINGLVWRNWKGRYYMKRGSRDPKVGGLQWMPTNWLHLRVYQYFFIVLVKYNKFFKKTARLLVITMNIWLYQIEEKKIQGIRIINFRNLQGIALLFCYIIICWNIINDE